MEWDGDWDLFCFFRFIYLFDRQRVTGRKGGTEKETGRQTRNRSPSLFPKWPLHLSLSQAEVTSQERHLSLPHRSRGSSTWAILHSIPGYISKKKDQTSISIRDGSPASGSLIANATTLATWLWPTTGWNWKAFVLTLSEHNTYELTRHWANVWIPCMLIPCCVSWDNSISLFVSCFCYVSFC